LSDTDTAKLNFITSKAMDIITAHYIHEMMKLFFGVLCFICVTQRWALHVVI